MRGIDVRVQETDRHRLDVLRAQGRDQALQRSLIERQQHGAIRSEPFSHLQSQLTRDQGLGSLHVKIVLFETVLVGDLQ